MKSLTKDYKEALDFLLKNLTHEAEITEKNVLQHGIDASRDIIRKMAHSLALPGSQITGLDNILKLYRLARDGKSCLLLLEHYSNFDLPSFDYLLAKSGPEGEACANDIIAMAGKKLNEDSDLVRACVSGYHRIVIYPSRSIGSIKDPAILEEETRKSKAINRAAMHEMVRAKNTGKIILMFPSGTRFRPWDPETKRGVKEVDSYLKAFDYTVFIGINGNALKINKEARSMIEDHVEADVLIFTASEVTSCSDFRAAVRANYPDDAPADVIKQAVADAVMARLDELHTQGEKLHTELTKNN